jgi:hypothetical protein
MPTEVSWYQENRVILVRVWGEATSQDMQGANDQIIPLIQQGAKTTPLVHMIADVRAMTKFPMKLNEVGGAQTYLKEPGLGWVIVVGMSPMVRFIASMITQIMEARFRMFPTFAEGIAFLVSRDSAIMDLSEPYK